MSDLFAISKALSDPFVSFFPAAYNKVSQYKISRGLLFAVLVVEL
jgi:hypothetical protein